MKYIGILAGSTDPHSKDWGYLPYLFITIGNTVWALSWTYPSQHNINFAEITFIRGITLILVNYLVCRVLGIPTDFKNTANVLTLRSVFMGIHSFVFAISQFILPLPIVHTIACCGTLFVFLVDFCMYGIRINMRQGVGIVVGFMGSLIAVNGNIITKMIDEDYQYHTKFQNYITDDAIIKGFFSLVFLGAMAVWALGIVITKKAQANTFQINFILGLVFVVLGAVAYPYLDNKSSVGDLAMCLLTTGLPLVFGQWFFIASLTMTKNHGVLNMMNFITIFIGLLISTLRYHEKPNIVSMCGIGLVFFGVWKTVFNKEVVVK